MIRVPIRRATAPPVEVFAVEDRSAQVVVRTPDARVVDVDGLEPGATQLVEVDGHHVEVSTLAALPGPELTRIATLSDLHLGISHHFGVRDEPSATAPFALRCARAAVREAVAWGAELIVLKGDLTHHGREHEWELLRGLLDDIPVPVAVMIGNHETYHLGRRRDRAGRADGAGRADRADRAGREQRLHPHKALADLGQPYAPVTWVDVPGARVLLADTTVPATGRGRVERSVHDAVVEAASASPAPVVLMLHHHLERLPVPVVYPFGVAWPGAVRLLRALRAANPAVFVTSGHSHRNRARVQYGVRITEVGSVKDFPGVWAGYVVHTGGVRQVVRRIAAPDCVPFIERTASALGGLWGWWTPGSIDDRCVVHPWPDRAPHP